MTMEFRPPPLAPSRVALEALATGRTEDFFAGDLMRFSDEIRRHVHSRRLLIIGGAGSIGRSTLASLAELGPAALHVADRNENALADLVRDLRGRPEGLAIDDFQTLPLDFGGPAMQRLLTHTAPYDHVLNFAALKHVRSEKDVCSVLEMLDTNIVKQARLLRWLRKRGGTQGYFAVSTDKAANPTSLMGASKRAMELTLLAGATGGPRTTSARFANVAYSDGSLLQAFGRWLARGQPLAVPADAKRFFVTQGEASAICSISAFVLRTGLIGIPKLEPEQHLRLLQDVAEGFLRLHGLDPVQFDDETEARGAVAALAREKRWPLLLTPLDTAGEKAAEEFVGAGERVEELGMSRMAAISLSDARGTDALVAFLEKTLNDPDSPLDVDALAQQLAARVPTFRHRRSAKQLDHRL